jgi:N-acetylglucosamine kinase-like BadF-type ATPase
LIEHSRAEQQSTAQRPGLIMASLNANLSLSDSLYVGVDGGGTSTTVVVINSQSQLLSESSSGSTNFNSVGIEAAKANLIEGIREALLRVDKSQHNVSLLNVESIICGVSGCNHPNDSKLITGWIEDYLQQYNRENQTHKSIYIRAYNDSIAALSSGTLGELSGMVLICGTGMIAYGRNPNNSKQSENPLDKPYQSINSLQEDQHNPIEWITGGNGALMDAGSGFNIGLDCVKAAFRLADGMMEQDERDTIILKQVVEHAQVKTVEGLVPYIYGKLEWSKIAAFAPIAIKNYNNSSVAKQIIDNNVKYLIDAILALQKKLKFNPQEKLRIVLVGGIIQSELMSNLVSQGIKAVLSNAQFLSPQVDPAHGAALLGLKYCQHKK